jgi:cytochrome c peroxidase
MRTPNRSLESPNVLPAGWARKVQRSAAATLASAILALSLGPVLEAQPPKPPPGFVPNSTPAAANPGAAATPGGGVSSLKAPPPGGAIVQQIVHCEHVRAISMRAVLTESFPADELHVILGPESYSPSLEAATMNSTATTIAALKTDNEVGRLSKELILVGLDTTVAKAVKVCAELDHHRPQVRLRVKISDIDFTGLRQLGIAYDFSSYSLVESSSGSSSAGSVIQKLGFGTLGHAPISVTATLSALEQRNQSKTLAEPSLSLLDGERGFILIGDRILYPKLTGYTQAQTPIYDKEEVRVGIYLQVALQMSGHGDLTLAVYPQVSTISGYLTVDGASYPQISTREAQTTVRLHENETLVIGGLIDDEEVKGLQQIPFLGSVPVLGELFRSRNHSSTRKDLVIMITPEILRDSHAAAGSDAALHAAASSLSQDGDFANSLPLARPIFPAAPPPAPLGLPEVSWPATNSYSAAKAELGWFLFFDKRLSADGNVACGSCHMPEAAFTDRRERSTGAHGETGRRNAQSVVNAAYFETLLWDGAANSLEEQAKLAMTKQADLGMDAAKVLKVIQSIPEYRPRFQQAFGRGKYGSIDQVADAIATFERLLVSGNSAYDRYVAGDARALTPAQQHGLDVFKKQCAVCHPPPLFTRSEYVALGVGRPGLDSGRLEVTGNPTERNQFRPPGLREVLLTAPYMHDGSIKTIDDVLHFYLMGRDLSSGMDERAGRIFLTGSDLADVAKFLEALKGEGWQRYRAPLMDER